MGKVVRVSKKNTIYIPKDIAVKAGISEGSYIEIKVENNRIILIPIRDPLWLAFKGPKFAELSPEEVEAISEEEQDAYVGDDA